MTHYIGTKIIKATAMTRLAFCSYIGREIDPKTDGDEAGYLVEYTDGGKPNHPSHEGYISWSPKAQFDAAYTAIGDVGHLPPHQQRVVAEKVELDDRLTKLKAFMETDRFKGLGPAEQDRMHAQANAMARYFGVLADRIEAFGGSN